MQFTALVAALVSVAAVQAQRQQICITPQFDCGATRSLSYKIVKDDTLTKIAQDYYRGAVGICDIARANNIKDKNLIIEGQTLLIPINCQSIDDTNC